MKRCNELMNQSDVVLFMKGDRDTPRYVQRFTDKVIRWRTLLISPGDRIRYRCGFSQKIVGILNDESIEYTTFDILADEGVRQSTLPSPSSLAQTPQTKLF